jgi:hypothetical protein
VEVDQTSPTSAEAETDPAAAGYREAVEIGLEAAGWPAAADSGPVAEERPVAGASGPAAEVSDRVAEVFVPAVVVTGRVAED